MDPTDHDCHAIPNPTCLTVRCLRNMEMEKKNRTSISNGAENCKKFTPKSNLLMCAMVAWGGIKDSELDSYFYVQDAHIQDWHNLFFNPDILSKNEIAAHEDYLKRNCP